MDNAIGALVIAGLVIAAIVWVVSMVLAFLAGTFVVLTSFFGHPVFVIAVLGAVGAGLGMAQLHRRQGAFVARSDDDYAMIGSLRLTPEQWVALVLCGFVAALGLYGFVFVSGHVLQLSMATIVAPSSATAIA